MAAKKVNNDQPARLNQDKKDKTSKREEFKTYPSTVRPSPQEVENLKEFVDDVGLS